MGISERTCRKDETEIETAIREVKEETNLDVEIDANKRYTMEYVTDKGTLKQVVLFIAKCTGGEIKAQECEVNDIKWLDFDEAMQTITYDNTRELFKKYLRRENIGGNMKVLTIKQPWATLIMQGDKRFEFRSWQTKYRGDLLIHAGKGIDKEAMKRLAKYIPEDLPAGKY